MDLPPAAPEPNEPPDELIDRAAETFTRTKGDIRDVVRTIITSPEFFSSSAFRSKVKTPFEVVVSALRALAAAPDPSPRTAMIVSQLGQPISGRQTPDGWPDVASEWMGTGAILNRINFGLAVGANRLPGGRVSPETREILISGRNPLQQGEVTDGERPIPPLQGLAQIVGLAIGSPEFQRR